MSLTMVPNNWISMDEAVEDVSSLCPYCWLYNNRTKYVKIHVDTRDNKALLLDRHGVQLNRAEIQVAVNECTSHKMHAPGTKL